VVLSDRVAVSAARGPLGDPVGVSAESRHWPTYGALRGARRLGDS